MNIFNQLGKVAQNSGKLLQKQAENYLVVSPATRQVILKAKTVELLCQQAVQRVEQMTALEIAPDEGLIATVEHQKVKLKVHFTPEKILLKGDLIEGQLRLIQKPQVESESFLYRTLIAGWNTFLGGHIPDQALPKGVRLDGNLVYYAFPVAQLRLIEALFHNLEDGSSLNLELKQGELRIDSAVAINWSDINLLSLIQLFTASANKKP